MIEGKSKLIVADIGMKKVTETDREYHLQPFLYFHRHVHIIRKAISRCNISGNTGMGEGKSDTQTNTQNLSKEQITTNSLAARNGFVHLQESCDE